MRSLKELEKTSPYPVNLNDPNENGKHCSGSFSSFPQKISISENGTPAEKFSVLTHEIQHANCHKKGCFCMKGPHNRRSAHYREYHAMKAELVNCMDYKKALRYSIFSIDGCAAGKWGWKCHISAARQIVKTKLWAEACLASV